MSPSTRIWSTLGMAASTASSASMLLCTSESRSIVGPEAGSGVDAFVGVEEEDAYGGGDRNRDEEPEDASKVTAHDKRNDDQHRAEVNGVAEDLWGDEVVDDVRDHEVEDQDQDDLARRLRNKGGDGDRREGAEEWPDERDESRDSSHDAERE